MITYPLRLQTNNENMTPLRNNRQLTVMKSMNSVLMKSLTPNSPAIVLITSVKPAGKPELRAKASSMLTEPSNNASTASLMVYMPLANKKPPFTKSAVAIMTASLKPSMSVLLFSKLSLARMLLQRSSKSKTPR